MDLLNSTGMAAGYTLGMDPSGREYLVVAVKGTFNLPLDGSPPTRSENPLPLVEADVYAGDPGFSAPLYEADYALRKAACDVILNGSAYAPNGEPAPKVTVGLKIGRMAKSFNVIGDRFWESPSFSIGRSPPRPFLKMPIPYDRAYGGCDNFHPDESRHCAFMQNPVGKGFHHNLQSDLVHGTPLPNTEETKNPVMMPEGGYRPMSFGIVGRGWDPRYRFAGTYDQNWIDNVFPFLPADFSEAYYQCAPADQQIDYLRGGEEVFLVNLTPTGKTRFRIPRVDVPVVFFLKKNDPCKTEAVADTLVIEPDLSRFTITWRASLPLKKNLFEVVQVLAGKKSRAWWRARESGKDYHPSLRHLAAANKAETE